MKYLRNSRAAHLLLFSLPLAFLLLFLALCISSCGQTTSTSAAPGIKTGRTLYVDGLNGNNTRAERGRLDKPYQTIAAAITAATSGDTVQVRSGNYAEFLTLKDGVNLAFDPGAKILHTSGNGDCISDGGNNVSCTIHNLQINASGAGEIFGVVISGASSDIIISSGEILVTTTTDGAAVDISGGTVRMTSQKINGYRGVRITGGTVTLNTLTVQSATSGLPAIHSLGGTLVANVGRIVPATNAQAINVQGGAATIAFQSIDDSALSATATISQSGGTLILNGTQLARTTTGNGISVSAGTCNIESLDITGTFSGGDVALAQSSTGTINIMPNVHYPAGETSGTITRKNLFGIATSGSTGTGSIVLNTAPTFSGLVTVGTSGQISIGNNSGIGTQIFDMTNNVDANVQIRVTAAGASPKFARLAPNTDTELRLGQNNTDVIFIRDTGKFALGATNASDITRLRHGTATLVAGTVVVSDANVTASSIFTLTGQNSSGTHGELTISARSAGVSFTISSSSGTDTRAIGWTMIEP